MIALKRTNSTNKDFEQLVQQLDRELAIRDGDNHAFFAQFNHIDTIKYVVLAYEGTKAIGCGAIKTYEGHTMEVKRMYTIERYRGQGIATLVLKELELWAKELGSETCILETGLQQPEAIQLYKKNNYVSIPNYGQYATIKDSRCFKKQLTTL